MYQQWNQFRQQRQDRDFAAKVDHLCECVLYSGMTFNEYWQQHGLPVVLAETYTNADELLEAWYNPFSWGQGQQAAPAAAPAPAPAAPAPAAPPLDGANPTGPAAGGKKDLSADTQAKVKASTAAIKQQLMAAMQSIVQKMKQNRDRVGYQVANLVVNKMQQTLPKMIDDLKFTRGENKFDANAAFGPSPMVGKAAAAKADPAMQAKLAQQRARQAGGGGIGGGLAGNAPLGGALGAPQNLADPGVAAMQQKLQQQPGYDPFNPANYASPPPAAPAAAIDPEAAKRAKAAMREMMRRMMTKMMAKKMGKR